MIERAKVLRVHLAMSSRRSAVGLRTSIRHERERKINKNAPAEG